MAYAPHTARYLSFAEAKPRFADGGDTPRAYLERCLETIDTLEPKIKAFVCLDLEQARVAADAAAFPPGQLAGWALGGVYASWM